MRLKAFNKDKSLRKLHNKRNKDKYIMISTVTVCFTVIFIGILLFTYARYESEKEFTLINATVGDFKSGDYTIAAYVDNVKSRSIPAKDSGYYLQKVECESGTGTWDSNTWALTVEGATTQTKCYVYFTTLIAEADTTGQYATLSKYYPVGSIYQSLSSTSPSELFGGTWQEITDTMLIAKGSTYNTVNDQSYTKDSGNDTATLSVSNIPSHSHTYTPSGSISSSFTGTRAKTENDGAHTHSVWGAFNSNFGVTATSGSSSGWSGQTISISGGAHQHYYTPSGTVSSTFSGTSSSTTGCTNCNGTAFSIMNPYKVVYMWVRTA